MRSTATLSLSLATRLISATSRVCPWRTGWFRRGLPRRGPAVAARVGAGEQHAGGGVAADDLDAARAVEVADGPDGRGVRVRRVPPPGNAARWSEHHRRHAASWRIGRG